MSYRSKLVKVVEVSAGSVYGQPYEIEPGWELVDTCPIQYGCNDSVSTQVGLVLCLVDRDMYNGYVTKMNSLESHCNDLAKARDKMTDSLAEAVKDAKRFQTEAADAGSREWAVVEEFRAYKADHEQAERTRQKMEQDLAKIREVLGSREMDRMLGDK